MSGNLKKEDLRIIKTYKALMAAMLTLLERRNFGRITVNDLCEEAQISRATFYAHFNDKYDLLKYWLTNSKPEIKNKEDPNAQLKENINYFIYDKPKVLKNLVEDANSETLDLLHEVMISLLDITASETEDSQMSFNHIVLSSFCAGGIVNFIVWQLKNKFPPDLQMMTYFYKMLIHLLEWDAEQE